jgi:hypothetical protein
MNARTLSEARTIARESNQLAVWELKGGREVRIEEAEKSKVTRTRKPDALLNTRAASDKDLEAFVAELRKLREM